MFYAMFAQIQASRLGKQRTNSRHPWGHLKSSIEKLRESRNHDAICKSPLERMPHEGKRKEAAPPGELVDVTDLGPIDPQEGPHLQSVIARAQVSHAFLAQVRESRKVLEPRRGSAL